MPTSFDALLKNWLTKISNSIKGISVSGDTLTVTKTDNSTEDLTLGLQALEKKIFAQSTWYKRPQLMTTGTGGVAKREILIHKGTQVAINNNLYVSTQDVTLDASIQIPGASNRAGKDVYVYACVPTSGTEPDFVLSLNSTVPTGYTADTSRKIGGFHCLCADVGTIADHPLSGYLAGDILPASVWDLLFRAEAENVGLVFINGKWYGIYMGSSYGGLSKYNDPMYGWNHSGEMILEGLGRIKQLMITRDEFVVISQGSNQKTSVGDTSQIYTGGHTDTDGRRMISNYGLEDCCGFRWQQTADIWGAFNGSATTFSGQGGLQGSPQTSTINGTQNLTGYTWQTDGRGTTIVTRENTQNLEGLAYGALVRAMVGGDGNSGVGAGSRSVRLDLLSPASGVGNFGISSRGCSMPRIVNI